MHLLSTFLPAGGSYCTWGQKKIETTVHWRGIFFVQFGHTCLVGLPRYFSLDASSLLISSSCKGLILFHILISSHFLLLASIFEFQCFGLFSGLTCPKFMGLEPLCYSYFCAFLGLLSVTWLSHVTLCHVAVICCKMSLICTCLHIFVHICTY